MATQKRSVKTILASVVVGALIVAVGAAGLFALEGGTPAGLFGDAAFQGQATTTETREVTDSVGRTVSVPVEPQRIAAMDAFSGNVCVLAGAGDRLMGAPGGVTSNEMLQEISHGLSEIQQLSGNAINAETLLAAGVDVALVKRDLYDGGEETAKLDKLGIPYVVVDYGTVDEQMEAIRLVGQVCGGSAQDKASSIAEYYQQTVNLVEERAAALPQSERKQVYHSINDALLTDGSGSLGADWITRCGAVDVSAQEAGVGGTGDYTATLEQVYAWAPDVIICNTASACKNIASDAQWQGMQSVSSGAVCNIPVSTSRWGQRGDPETFLAMLWLGKTLYPAQYEDIDVKETVVSYYREVIGLEIDDAMWDAIVSGEGLRADGSGGGAGSGSGGGGK